MPDILSPQDSRRRKLCRQACLCLLIAWSFSPAASAAEKAPAGEFVNRIYQDEQGRHKYVVFVPNGYTAEKSWPAIVWLHGASSRGRDGRSPLVSGIAPNILYRETSPFLVVFPQCENLDSRLLGGWTDERADADRALKILTDAEQAYRIDPKRRTLAGVSMGAFGVWAIAARTPEMWSALIPVSGGGPQSVMEPLKNIPVWAFHAADDQVVPPEASSSLVDAIASSGGAAYYSELPTGGHNIGSRVFAKDEVYAWLLDPRRPPRQPRDWTIDPEAVSQLQDEIEFVPGAEIERAVHIHIGTDLLEALAHSLPAQVPADALQGGRGPQSQSSGSGRWSFQVAVSGVQYSGQVRAARLEPLDENQFRIRIGIQPLTMTVLSTEIQGRILRAQAGAMQAVIGAQRPAWLNIVVRPRIESRKLRLELVSAEFPIESDNWYVTEPNGVDVFPLPMLRDRISQRLTDGLYAKRGEIEQQVAAGVPKLLAQIEERALAQTDRVVTFGRWPMPVWQPRAKLWPSAVSIDSRGLTLSLGVTLAALVSNSDPVPLRKHAGPAHAPAMSTGGVQISMARDVVRIWTELLAASDVRRFHVNDFHAEDFHRLADRDFLSQVMPGLIDRRGTTELRSVLSFEQPMLLEPVDQDDSSQKQTASSQMRLTGRELRLTISERAAREAPWTALAEFPLAWSQDFQIEMEKVSHRRRKVLLSSVTRPRVESSGRVLKLGVKPNQVLRHQLVAEQFRKGWEATFATALAKQIALPERVISGISLACDNLGVQDDYLVIQLAQPTTQIRNLSAVPLTYQVRHETSGWSLPQILQPGMLHDYRSAGPLTWRCRVDDREFLYTLPAGSVSHYRGGERPLLLVPDRPIPEVAGWPDVLIR